jgi:VanZ family protein
MWMGVIFAFSSRPIVVSGQLEIADFIIKKGAHVCEYLLLYILLSRAAHKRIGLNGAFLLALLYAFTDETHQLFVPGRGGKISDVLMFDLAGITIGYLITLKWKKLWK